MEIIASTVILQPGMYILRHPRQSMAPLSVARAPGASASGKMETLGTPGTHGAVLRDGGDCIVLHISEAPVTLLVSAFIERKDDPVPALRLDQIALERTSTPVFSSGAAPAPAAAGMQIRAQGITLIGHIERTGDAVAAPGERLGDPDSLLRVEGLQVMWPDRPDGVDIAYSIVVENGGTMPIVKTGKFCGTRGEARRITEVTFALIGPRAGQFRLEGMAHFSGGFQVALQSAVALSGPSGLEHLTALSLCAMPAAEGAHHVNPWHESATTRVFKETTAAPTIQQ